MAKLNEMGNGPSVLEKRKACDCCVAIGMELFNKTIHRNLDQSVLLIRIELFN